MASSSSSGSSSSPWPHFLLPSITTPFRRRRTTDDSDASTTSSSSSSPPPSSSPSSAPPPPATTTLRCANCSADLAFAAQIVSKGFTGRHGHAYLVAPPSAAATPTCPAATTSTTPYSNLANVRVGRSESRRLATGAHVVADIFCRGCSTKVGWKYVDAREPAQRYKIGKFILETSRVVAFRDWGDGPDPAAADLVDPAPRAAAADGPVEFDSADEDECDELFSGVWDPHVVAMRRRAKADAAAARLVGAAKDFEAAR